MDCISDGNIHAYSHEWAYIEKEVEELTFDPNDSILNETIEEFLEKYAEYLCSFGKERIKSIIKNKMFEERYDILSEEWSFGYRTPMGKEKGKLYLKFRRGKNDNLKEMEYDDEA